MLKTILGIIWIALGLWWVVRPEALKARLKRKMNRRIRFMVFFFAIMLGLVVAGSVLNVQGMIAKVIGIAGLVIAIKAIMVLTSRSAEKVLSWWGNRPVMFFRIWAVIFILLGAGMLASA